MDNINVLLVNSRVANPDPIKRSLERIRTYSLHIDHLHTHSSALTSFRQKNYDFVLLEHELAQGSGKLLARRMVHQDSNTPVVIFTGEGNEKTCAMYFRMGVADYRLREHIDRNLLRSIISSTVVDRQTHRVENQIRTTSLNLLHNKRYIIRRIKEEMSSAVRHNNFLSICLMNLEKSRRSDEVHQVLSSERLLSQVRKVVQSMLREEDVIGRFGSENFIFVLRNTDSGRALRTATELSDNLQNTSFSNPMNGPVELNVFFGLAEFNGYRFNNHEDCEDVRDFINRAEKTLQLATNQCPGTVERRQFRRLPIDPPLPVNITLHDHQETAHLLNFSRNGAKVGQSPFLCEGQRLAVKVETEQSSEVIREGTVRTCQQQSNTSKAVLGVELQKHWPQNVMSKFCQELDREPVWSNSRSVTNDI